MSALSSPGGALGAIQVEKHKMWLNLVISNKARMVNSIGDRGYQTSLALPQGFLPHTDWDTVTLGRGVSGPVL